MYEKLQLKLITYLPKNRGKRKQENQTNGGKQSSAALRGTENPPWVLVSEAVRVLQNMWGVDFVGDPPPPSSSTPSPSSSLPSKFMPANYTITQKCYLLEMNMGCLSD